MGEVFEAEDQKLQESVALKTLLPQIARNPAALSRFRREIQLSRRVTHPSVCRVYELGDGGPNNSIPFFTMELLRGRTLSSHLRENGPIEPDEAMPIAEQLAQAKRKLRRVFAVHKYLSSPTKGSVPGETMVPLRSTTPAENARRRGGQRPAGAEAPLRGLGTGQRFRLVPRPASN